MAPKAVWTYAMKEFVLVSGLSQLENCPLIVQYYWQNTLLPDPRCETSYEETNDYQLFVFEVSESERTLFQEEKILHRVVIYENAEGLIGYQGIARV